MATVEFSETEMKVLGDFWATIPNEHGDFWLSDFDITLGCLVRRMSKVLKSTVILPGPNGGPNIEVPQEGWLD